MTELLALAQEQLADIAAVQREQAKVIGCATAADGLVEVTVDARGHVVKTVIDESYLEEYELAELADHITEAAQAAARRATQRVSEMMAPISDRRNRFPAMSEVIDGAPDLRDLTPPWLESDPAPTPGEAPEGRPRDETSFPVVRR